MQRARQAQDVRTVRRFAVAVLELGVNNERVLRTHIDLKRPLKVIALLGTDRHGQRTILIEIGMSRGVPWGGTHGQKIRGRWRATHYRPTPSVRNAIIRTLGIIAEHRMNGWKTSITFKRNITHPNTNGRVHWSNYEFYRGIRFVFSRDDEELVDFLRWHEVYHSSSLRAYLSNRIDRVLAALTHTKSTSRTRKGALTRRAESLLGVFTRSETLRDPYVFAEFARMVGESGGRAARAALLNFLNYERVISLDLVKDASRARPKIEAVPRLGVEVRLACKRRDGTISYQIHRSAPRVHDYSGECPF